LACVVIFFLVFGAALYCRQQRLIRDILKKYMPVQKNGLTLTGALQIGTAIDDHDEGFRMTEENGLS